MLPIDKIRRNAEQSNAMVRMAEGVALVDDTNCRPPLRCWDVAQVEKSDDDAMEL